MDIPWANEPGDICLALLLHLAVGGARCERLVEEAVELLESGEGLSDVVGKSHLCVRIES